MCLYVDDWERTTLDTGQRRARKPHRCQECERTIDPGEVYRYWVVVDADQGFTVEKMCAHCWNTIELGASFTGCPKAWYWGSVHDLRGYGQDEGSFLADIWYEHVLTTAQKRAVVRCLRGYRRRWRDDDGALLPLVVAA